MVHHRIIHSLVWWLLWFPACFPAQRLLFGQHAPLFRGYTRGSGSLIPVAPFVGRPNTVASPAFSTNVINKDGVDRQESIIFNVKDGKLVNTVEGHYAYTSPEGIPVFVYYIAGDNGYQASFRLGTAVQSSPTTDKPPFKLPPSPTTSRSIRP